MPLHFVELNPADAPKYRSKRIDNYLFAQTIRKWNQKVIYRQKWQTTDVIYLQFESNFDPIDVNLINCAGITVETIAAIQKRVNKYEPGLYVYEVAISLAAIPPGVYNLSVELPDRVLISEPQDIRDVWENTLLLSYRNSKYHEDVIWETGIKCEFRIEGREGFLAMGSEDTLYSNQKMNPKVLSSKTFENYPYTFGGTKGMPDWAARTVFKIFSCDEVTIDGVYFSRNNDSKWSYKETERYQMRTMTTTLQEGLNRSSIIINPTVDPNKKLLYVYNIKSGKLYGDVSSDAAQTVIRPIASE